MKKSSLLKYFLIIILIAIVFIGYKLIGPSTLQKKEKYLFVENNLTQKEVAETLVEKGFISSTTWFNNASRIVGLKTVKAGRYEIKKGMSLYSLAKMLKNGKQSPVSFSITKIRTKEALAGKMGKAFQYDSLQAIQFLSNNDSLKQYGVDTNTVMSLALPLTYDIYWNTTPSDLIKKFQSAYQTFWTEERKQKASALGLTPIQVISLASIIDEESNDTEEKPTIASTYLNRVKIGMPLQADPTVKFALKDFGIKRILLGHLQTPSPYNTYKNKGIPPGPICTPQTATIDAVLNAPKTDYLYFVADSSFNGKHLFTTNYQDHLKLAKAYQEALNKRNIK
ncbi:MAG: endolytic transglycosylase MltG [Chitinophagaceae bacterium]|nr:MAG: endolytic transglycosylase MltG [Chitinophagaceae bacterium]